MLCVGKTKSFIVVSVFSLKCMLSVSMVVRLVVFV